MIILPLHVNVLTCMFALLYTVCIVLRRYTVKVSQYTRFI